jgi:hypothetical protein
LGVFLAGSFEVALDGNCELGEVRVSDHSTELALSSEHPAAVQRKAVLEFPRFPDTDASR